MLIVLLIIVAVGIVGVAFARTVERERRWRQIERDWSEGRRTRDRW